MTCNPSSYAPDGKPTWTGERTTYDSVVHHLATRALERSAGSGRVDAFVSDGCVILSGTVGSDDDKLDAEFAVRSVPGVTGVLNCIAVARRRA